MRFFKKKLEENRMLKEQISSKIDEHKNNKEMNLTNMEFVSSILDEFDYDELKSELGSHQNFWSNTAKMINVKTNRPKRINQSWHHELQDLDVQRAFAELDLEAKLKDLEEAVSTIKSNSEQLATVAKEAQKVSKKSFFVNIADYCKKAVQALTGTVEDYWTKEEDTSKKMTPLEIVQLHGLSSEDEYFVLIEKWHELEGAKRLLKALSRRKAFILNKIKNGLRNLRMLFKKLHSFHFKNLDDYHSTNLNLSF